MYKIFCNIKKSFGVKASFFIKIFIIYYIISIIYVLFMFKAFSLSVFIGLSLPILFGILGSYAFMYLLIIVLTLDEVIYLYLKDRKNKNNKI